MNCPNCGRTLGFGETCPCQQTEIFRRQLELESEEQKEQEQLQQEYEQSLKDRSETVKKVSEKGNKIFDWISRFAQDMFYNFMHREDIYENYINKKDTGYMIALNALNIFLMSVMTYLLLCKSFIASIFLYFSVFSISSKLALAAGSLFMMIASIVIMTLSVSYIIKDLDKAIFEVSASYIYTLPVTAVIIILTLISNFAGVLLLPVLLHIKSLWIMQILKNEKRDGDKPILITCLAILLCSIVFMVTLKVIS